MTKVVIVVKTNEGARWTLPQIDALLSRGALVTVVIPRGPGRLADELERIQQGIDGLTLCRSPFDFRFRPTLPALRGYLALRRLLRQMDADAALYHLYASALAVRFSLLGTRTRQIHMVAGPLYLESPYIRLFERWAVALDDVLIAGSRYTARRYVELRPTIRSIHTIPYGVDVDHFTRRPVARAPQPLAGRPTFRVIMVAYVYAPKRLAFAGRGIKGHATLLAAWQRFCRRHEGVELHLVGGGFDSAGERHRQELLTEFDHLFKEGTIQWTDSLEDVRCAYAAADLSVSPSLSENHGAALEAGAMCVPSIVSNAGGLPETVTAQSGWIVRAGSVDDLDAALEAAHEEWLKGTLTDRGNAARRHIVRNFDQAAAAARLADVVLDPKVSTR